jgi:predicted RNA-binding protein with PIN domain
MFNPFTLSLMKLIIDGYNLIFAERDLPASPNALERARNELIYLLTHYNLKKSYQIIVVFDGDSRFNWFNTHYIIPNPVQTRQARACPGIEIHFSASDSSADDLIKKMIYSYTHPGLESWSRKRVVQDAQVVTSDRELIRTANKMGITTIDSRDFLHELRDSFQPDLETPDSSKPSGVPEHQVGQWMKVFGFENGE